MLRLLLSFSCSGMVLEWTFTGDLEKTLIVLVPYVFSIVALALFLVSVVKSTQQFNAIISLVSVSLSMLGGAYWPLEIVSSDFLLKVSNFVPIKHAMEGLKAATIYGASINELLYPISILTLMGVVLIGIGINVMERKTHNLDWKKAGVISSCLLFV